MSAQRQARGVRTATSALEFLGDRVLGLVVSEMLCEAYPKAPEGELSRRLAALVRKESCATAAQTWGVGSAPLSWRGREAQRRAREGRDPERRLRVADRRGVPRRRLRGGARAWSAARSTPRCARRPHALRDPKTDAAGMGAGPAALPPPLYREAARSGPDHAPLVRHQRHGRRLPALRGRRAPRSAWRNKRPRDAFSTRRRRRSRRRLSGLRRRREHERRRKRSAQGAMSRSAADDALRLRRADRRAQRRQVDAVQRARRRQKCRSSRAKPRRRVRSCAGVVLEHAAQIIFVDTPGLFSAQTPARPGDGHQGLGRRRRRRRRRADDRRAQGHG